MPNGAEGPPTPHQPRPVGRRWVGSLALGCKAHRSRQGTAGRGALFTLSVILVSQVKSYHGARGRKNQGPRTVLSFQGTGAGLQGVRVPVAVGTAGSQRPGEACGRRPFPRLQMGLTKIIVQVYQVLTK